MRKFASQSVELKLRVLFIASHPANQSIAALLLSFFSVFAANQIHKLMLQFVFFCFKLFFVLFVFLFFVSFLPIHSLVVVDWSLHCAHFNYLFLKCTVVFNFFVSFCHCSTALHFPLFNFTLTSHSFSSWHTKSSSSSVGIS